MIDRDLSTDEHACIHKSNHEQKVCFSRSLSPSRYPQVLQFYEYNGSRVFDRFFFLRTARSIAVSRQISFDLLIDRVIQTLVPTLFLSMQSGLTIYFLFHASNQNFLNISRRRRDHIIECVWKEKKKNYRIHIFRQVSDVIL